MIRKDVNPNIKKRFEWLSKKMSPKKEKNNAVKYNLFFLETENI